MRYGSIARALAPGRASDTRRVNDGPPRSLVLIRGFGGGADLVEVVDVEEVDGVLTAKDRRLTRPRWRCRSP